MPRRELFLGVDAGSSVCKAALFDGAGRLIAVAAQPTPLLRLGARVEVDPAQVWAAAVAVLRQMVEPSSTARSFQSSRLCA